MRWSRSILGAPFALGLGALALGASLGHAAGCVTSGNGSEPGLVTSGTLDPGSDAGVVVRLDGGGAEPTPPDGVGACPKGACNFQSNAGCDGGASCLPIPGADGVAPTCYPGGAAPSGGACTQWSDCAPGHLCDGTGHCRKLCCGGDWRGCPDGEHCLETLALASDAGPQTTGAMLCTPVGTCDPLVPASCEEPGTTCQIADASGAVACLPEGTGGAGEPCPCKGGFLCVLQNEKPVCHRL
jgi:hypothetical protein